MKKPSQEELETMRDARTASLIRRWLAGKKLTQDEKLEVSQNSGIPIEILNLGPLAPGAKEAVQRAKSTRKHAKYPKKLPEYAAFYGKDERTIKRLIRRGKEVDSLPPLDEPVKMPAWWRRNMDHEVPDWLLGFTDPSARNGDGGSAPAGGTGDSGDAAPRDFSQVKSLSIEENVAALRQSHAVNKHLYDEALHSKEPNEQTIALRQRNYERTFELLRKAETSLIELKQKSGDLIDKESVRAELAQVFESLRLMRETMPRRIIVEVEKILPRPLRRVWRLIEKTLFPAVEKARADEENIFRNLDNLTGREDIEKLLAA